MASSFYAWSIFVIMYQTVVCVVFGWMVLECRLMPHPAEPRELTLIKMLYLFEPETCGRTFYYNYSVVKTDKNTVSNMLWMKSNSVAASFRNKMKLWVSLHVAWLGLSLLNASQGRRACGFYAILLPLTVIGIALLVVDLVHAALFLHDATQTQTETEIWNYIKNVEQMQPPSFQLTSISELDITDDHQKENTSWVALLFAYVSLRAIVQWIVNFWIVQDNYFDGLRYYRELNLQESSKHRMGIYE